MALADGLFLFGVFLGVEGVVVWVWLLGVFFKGGEMTTPPCFLLHSWD